MIKVNPGSADVFRLDAVGEGRYILALNYTGADGYTVGRYLFNDFQATGTENDYFEKQDGSLSAVEAFRKDNALYVIVSGPVEVTDISALDDMVEAGTVQKINLDEPNNFVFSFTPVEEVSAFPDGAVEIESERGGRVSIDDFSARARVSPYDGNGRIFAFIMEFIEEAVPPVVAEPSQPEGNRVAINLSLNIPVDEPFTATFTVRLPAGFGLSREATALAADLRSSFELEVTPNEAGGWLFNIRPKPSTRAAETAYRQVVQIACTMDETVGKGEYEVTLNDVSLTLNGGQVIHRDEIKVPVTLTCNIGSAVVEAADIHYANSLLRVNTPAAERVTVYSLSGTVMYQAQKAAGEASFDLNGLPKGVFIAKGSSGWTRKVVISD
ncbi:MAG: T9SS type A sorting domain-containing protein [Tannerella sp.]|nr:T9SS type A sorting domain-containing protein [Tannerella sp.]